ncbi:MAG TPA: hypothetical protein VKR42_06810, partial [Ktedonobacteraceae bacterium]|nr:hypothetical protein [Ktedonobacteraceae bacterium]
MPGKWDSSLKRLLGENPQHFIRWVLPEAEFKGKPVAKSVTLKSPEIEADSLYEIVLHGKACLVHIEFQSSYDR